MDQVCHLPFCADLRHSTTACAQQLHCRTEGTAHTAALQESADTVPEPKPAKGLPESHPGQTLPKPQHSQAFRQSQPVQALTEQQSVQTFPESTPPKALSNLQPAHALTEHSLATPSSSKNAFNVPLKSVIATPAPKNSGGRRVVAVPDLLPEYSFSPTRTRKSSIFERYLRAACVETNEPSDSNIEIIDISISPDNTSSAEQGSDQSDLAPADLLVNSTHCVARDSKGRHIQSVPVDVAVISTDSTPNSAKIATTNSSVGVEFSSQSTVSGNHGHKNPHSTDSSNDIPTHTAKIQADAMESDALLPVTVSNSISQNAKKCVQFSHPATVIEIGADSSMPRSLKRSINGKSNTSSDGSIVANAEPPDDQPAKKKLRRSTGALLELPSELPPSDVERTRVHPFRACFPGGRFSPRGRSISARLHRGPQLRVVLFPPERIEDHFVDRSAQVFKATVRACPLILPQTKSQPLIPLPRFRYRRAFKTYSDEEYEKLYLSDGVKMRKNRDKVEHRHVVQKQRKLNFDASKYDHYFDGLSRLRSGDLGTMLDNVLVIFEGRSLFGKPTPELYHLTRWVVERQVARRMTCVQMYAERHWYFDINEPSGTSFSGFFHELLDRFPMWSAAVNIAHEYAAAFPLLVSEEFLLKLHDARVLQRTGGFCVPQSVLANSEVPGQNPFLCPELLADLPGPSAASPTFEPNFHPIYEWGHSQPDFVGTQCTPSALHCSQGPFRSTNTGFPIDGPIPDSCFHRYPGPIPDSCFHPYPPTSFVQQPQPPTVGQPGMSHFPPLPPAHLQYEHSHAPSWQ